MPLPTFLTSERYVSEIFLRCSGAASEADAGPVAERIMRYGALVTHWLDVGPFRRDIPATLLAKGVVAFVVRAMALQFCALQRQTWIEVRLAEDLEA